MERIRLFASLVAMELRGFFTSPLVYGASAIYLLLSQGLAFRVLISSRLLTLAPYYQTGSYLMVLLALAVSTSRLTRDEPSLRFLSYRPVTTWEVVRSRLVAGAIFSFIMALMGLSLPVAVAWAGWGTPDFGAAVAGALGLGLLGTLSWSVGLFFSAVTGSQTVALMASLVAMFLLWLPYALLRPGAGSLGTILFQLSFTNHMRELGRGLVTFRALFYFLGLACIFSRATQAVLSSRTSRNPYGALVPGVALLFFLMILGYLGAWTPKWDLSSRKVYTLSDVTGSLLRSLDRDVKAVFVRPHDLPPELEVLSDEVSYFLTLYAEGSPRFTWALAYSDTDEGRRIAETYKLGKIKVMIRSGDEAKEMVMTFGIVLVSGERTEVISTLEDVSKLEYEVTSRLVSLMKGKRLVLFTEGQGEFPDPSRRSLRGGFAKLQEAITNYDFGRYDFGADRIPDDCSLLVVAGPVKSFPKERIRQIQEFLHTGKPVLFLVDGMRERHETERNVDPKAPFQWVPNETGLEELLGSMGVRVNHDVVLSKACYTPVEGGRVGAPFPLMPLVRVRGFKVPVAPFTVSSIDATPTEGYEPVPEMVVEHGWRHRGAYVIDPSFPRTKDTGSFVVGVYLRPKSEGLGQAYVIGDSDLFRDKALLGPHVDFFTYLVDRLTSDSRLAALRTKGMGISYLSVGPHRMWVVAGAISVPLVILAAFGLLYNLWLRRRG